MKYILSILVLLVATISLSAQTVSNVQANFSCPGQVTVTYDVDVSASGNATLYYSPDGGATWLEAKTVTQTNTTIVWDNRADNVKFGQFKLKVEVPKEPECIMINGVCWSVYNVDAPGTFVQNPEDFGMFYQWNSKVGWSATNPSVSTDGSSWNNSWNGGGATTWEKQNDPCPAGWRMPTIRELTSLNNAGSIWTTQNGVKGRLFGSGANSIFLPAMGFLNNSTGMLSDGAISDYWCDASSSAFGRAYALNFRSSNAIMAELDASYGQSVR
ncbi:MAG: fibrobacter succinogenes major paralogous domain-containing protein, partial [Bacteroidales bacterium]|nr:fibrobacter succinogenes major paralogous domain-containing protein [Bacteroidales bacterium]